MNVAVRNGSGRHFDTNLLVSVTRNACVECPMHLVFNVRPQREWFCIFWWNIGFKKSHCENRDIPIPQMNSSTDKTAYIIQPPTSELRSS